MLALGIIIGACIVGASNVALAWVRKQEASAKANGLSELNTLIAKLNLEGKKIEQEVVTAIAGKL